MSVRATFVLNSTSYENMAEADPAIPLPSQIPSSGSTPQPIAKPTSVFAVIRTFPSNTDAFLGRLQKCLSTPSGTDTILLLLCYGSKFVSEVLAGAGITTLRYKARQLVALVLSMPRSSSDASTSAAKLVIGPAPDTSLAAQFLGVSERLKALSGMLSDVRAFSRLWGLIGMYFWAKRLIGASKANVPASSQPPKMLDTIVAYASLITCIVFQSMENVAYLGSKKVLPVSPKTQGDLFRWSSRFWALYVGLDMGRLLRELIDRRNTQQQRRVTGAKAATENMDPAAATEAGKTHDEEEKVWLAKWRRQFLRQCAWAPLTLHYSSEKGLLSEALVGLIGSIPGFIQVGELWNEEP